MPENCQVYTFKNNLIVLLRINKIKNRLKKRKNFKWQAAKINPISTREKAALPNMNERNNNTTIKIA